MTSIASFAIEKCLLKLLAILEALELEELRKMLHTEYISFKNSKEGFIKTAESPDGDPYSIGLSKVRRYLRALESFFLKEDHATVTKDLLQIIRDIHYAITDKVLFRTTPSNEKDIHLPIEGILTCVFPDLKHKPSLTKQIKNFEPCASSCSSSDIETSGFSFCANSDSLSGNIARKKYDRRVAVLLLS